MLEIKSFDKLMGSEFFGRTIQSVNATIHFDAPRGPAYVFKFDKILRNKPKPTNSYHCWEDSFNVYLLRKPTNGLYELYVMGLHDVTVKKLFYSDVRDFGKFTHYFAETIRLSKEFWNESEKSN